MTKDERLRLERLYNLVRPSHLVTGLRDGDGYQPIALFEQKIKASDENAGLRVQVATVYRNDQTKPPTHPDNDREYHFAELLCAAVNALPERDEAREDHKREYEERLRVIGERDALAAQLAERDGQVAALRGAFAEYADHRTTCYAKDQPSSWTAEQERAACDCGLVQVTADVINTAAASAAFLAERDRLTQRARDEEYRLAFEIEFADPLVNGMTPEYARDVLTAMREANTCRDSRVRAERDKEIYDGTADFLDNLRAQQERK